MNVYAKIAGKMPYAPEQKAKFDSITRQALPAARPETGGAAPSEPKAIGAGEGRGEDCDSKSPA